MRRVDVGSVDKGAGNREWGMVDLWEEDRVIEILFVEGWCGFRNLSKDTDCEN